MCKHLCSSSSTQIDARDVKLAMGGQYNFIPIFYFFDIQAPISIRNFSGNKIFFKISLQEWKESEKEQQLDLFQFPACWSHILTLRHSQTTRGLVNFWVVCRQSWVWVKIWATYESSKYLETIYNNGRQNTISSHEIGTLMHAIIIRDVRL